MSSEDSGIDEARRFLREHQSRAAEGIPIEPTRATLKLALEKTADREAQQSPEAPGFLREGVFRYPVEGERARWALTRAILHRVQPGPYEDANFIAMLARQAASIEYYLGGSHTPQPDGVPAEVLARILVGTTGEPQSRGSARAVAGFSVIRMSAGMIDLLYQTAKAVVLAWKRVEPGEGGAVGFSTRAEDTAAVLDADPYPTDLLGDTLATWLYEGLPRTSYAKAPPPEYHPPLQLLINGAERFVLAHEYGHALMDHLIRGDEGELTQWDRELRADAFAATVVSQSALLLDLVPMNVALQGAILSMKAHDVFDAAFQLASTGEQEPGNGTPTHPPFSQRIAVLEQGYLEAHPNPEAAREELGGMTVPAETLDQLWQRVAPRFRAQFRAGGRLHPIWLKG